MFNTYTATHQTNETIMDHLDYEHSLIGFRNTAVSRDRAFVLHALLHTEPNVSHVHAEPPSFRQQLANFIINVYEKGFDDANDGEYRLISRTDPSNYPTFLVEMLDEIDQKDAPRVVTSGFSTAVADRIVASYANNYSLAVKYKIQMIKEYRAETNQGLLDSKHAIEAALDRIK